MKSPKDFKIKETDIIYRNTRIPKDPYSILPEHLDKARKIVDDMIAELDRLLDGKILKDGWLREDKMKLVYPPGAKLGHLNWDFSGVKNQQGMNKLLTIDKQSI